MVREQQVLRRQQATTQAKMIRACLRRIHWARNPEQSPAYRRAEGFHASAAARKEVIREGAQAMLYLESLATMLENQGQEPVDIGGGDATIMAQDAGDAPSA